VHRYQKLRLRGFGYDLAEFIVGKHRQAQSGSSKGKGSALSLCVFLLSTATSVAQTISVLGPTQSPSVGSTFAVNITATDSTDLYAFQFDLVYDPAILSVASVAAGKFLPSGGSTIFIPGSINNTSGVITLNADTLVGSISGVAGNGTLAVIQFAAVAPGTSAVSLQNLIFLDSTLSNLANSASIQNASVLVVKTGGGVPSITPGGVVPVYSSATTIQSGSWVSIYGDNLAGGTTSWNGNFPTSLGGVNVTINSKAAYLWFVSPTQINLQAPSDTATGTVNVAVTTSAGNASSTVTLGQYAPSFSLLNSRYPAAIVLTPGGPGNSGAGYDIIGPSGTFSYPSRPLQAGETVLLYGVGFGPTNPTVPAGQVFSGAAPCVVLPQVTIGGVSATVNFAGIVEAGLYQLNVVVPNAGSGDQLLQASAGGLATPNNIFLTLQ
jgi:uncharacterized protein (TIGR03437 family)